jgi:chromosome segregation ATPase
MNTQPQRQARLTLSEVQEAIQQLQEQGFDNPSIRQIYAALGHRGSFSKIMELKQQVLANKLPQLSNNVTYLDNNPESLLANNQPSIDNILSNKLDNTVTQLLANIEPQLWESLQARLEIWWSKHNSTNQQLEDLQKQVQELTTALQEMYQLWQGSTQSRSQSSPPVTEEVKETTMPVEKSQAEPAELNPTEFPNPQQTGSFVSWAQRQREQHNGSWRPVVEWLNQHHLTTPKGQLWTPKSLSDFVRKKKSQLSRVKSPT